MEHYFVFDLQFFFKVLKVVWFFENQGLFYVWNLVDITKFLYQFSQKALLLRNGNFVANIVWSDDPNRKLGNVVGNKKVF